MPRQPKEAPEPDPEVVAALCKHLRGFSQPALEAGMPPEEYELRLWTLLEHVKESVLADRASQGASPGGPSI